MHKFVKDHLCPMKSALCTNCKCNIEEDDHIIQCKYHSQRAIRTTWIKELDELLSENNTPATAKNRIMFGFTRWIKPLRSLDYQDPLAQTTSVFKAQDNIRWRHFIRGHFSQEWECGHYVSKRYMALLRKK
jgi:hypothetical protein